MFHLLCSSSGSAGFLLKIGVSSTFFTFWEVTGLNPLYSNMIEPRFVRLVLKCREYDFLFIFPHNSLVLKYFHKTLQLCTFHFSLRSNPTFKL